MKGDDAISRTANPRFSDIRRVDTTGSTNSDVMALARQGEPEGVVLVADHQTAGRGRGGRTWTAPAGGSLLCTVLLRPPARVAPLVTFALAVAAAEAVEQLVGLSPGLKWPNDLVVEETEADGTTRTRKLAGILAEAEWPAGSDVASGHRPPAAHERVTVAAGIGLNVRWPAELPDDLVDVAAALNHLVPGADVDRDDVLGELLDRFAVHYGRLVTGEAGRVLDDWRARSATLGRHVRVDLGAADVEGTAVDVDADGHLVIETGGGETRVLAVGDVVHVRPAG